MNIRAAQTQDQAAIQSVYSSAFPESESKQVSTLAVDLLNEQGAPQALSLVAELDGAVVGHIAYSPVVIEGHADVRGYILAPLAVDPDYQKRRVGSALIEYGKQALFASGVNVIFVYGDPAYYGRFGFDADLGQSFTTPYPLQFPFGWQALMLNPCEIEKPPVALTCVAALSNPDLW